MSSHPQDTQAGAAAAANGAHARRGSTSHLSADEQDKLERKLKNRPDASTLQQQGVLRDGGVLAAKKASLERAIAADNLAVAMDSRPKTDTLVSNHIIENAHVAPSLAATAKALERNIIADRLDHQLTDREDLNDLEDRNVMRAHDVAPRLRSTKIQLEHAITRDQLGHLLEGRPAPEDLLANNVLAAPAPVASKIQGVARQLQRNMTSDRVGHLLERRSDVDSLTHQNIMHDPHIAPSLQAPQQKLARNLAKANLYHALKHRPSRHDLEQMGVLEHDEEEAQSAAARYQEQPAYSYQRRSKNFHLTRVLLKTVAGMAEAGEISLAEKGYLKDLIVDQDATILSVAESFDADNNLDEFKDHLVRLARRH